MYKYNKKEGELYKIRKTVGYRKAKVEEDAKCNGIPDQKRNN